MRLQGDSQGPAGTQKTSPMERAASLWSVLEKKNGVKRHPSLALGVFFSRRGTYPFYTTERMIPMKKLRLCALSLLTAAALLLPALPARAEGLEVTAPPSC